MNVTGAKSVFLRTVSHRMADRSNQIKNMRLYQRGRNTPDRSNNLMLDLRSGRECHYGIGRLELLRMHDEFLPHLPLKTLLIRLYFLKVNPAEDVGAAAFSICRNTWRAHVKTGFGTNK